jgi:fibronectin-binding autotransporter adhesin
MERKKNFRPFRLLSIQHVRKIMKLKTTTLQEAHQKLFIARLFGSCSRLLVAIAVLVGSSMAYAQGFQADTWTGGGSDNNWMTPLNWGGSPPSTNGDDLIFSGSTQLSSVNNYSGLQLDSITFNNSGFILSGNALIITNGITDNAGSNTNSIALTLGASQTIQNTAGGTTNIESGTIALGTNNLTIGGGGNVFLNSLLSSPLGGTLTVNNGGVARLGPLTGSTANSFGTNGVITTITSTNTVVFTNVTYTTNLITNNVPIIITNTSVTTNNTFTLLTNSIVSVPDVITVQSGTLQFGGVVNGNHIPNGPSIGNVLINGTLDVNGVSEQINGLDGSGYIYNGNAADTGMYTFTLGNASSNGVFSGAIQDTSSSSFNSASGAVALTKTGFGTETLSGPNTYSGLTTLSQGTLAIGNGGQLGEFSKSMVIAPGAVLDVTALGVQGYYPQKTFNLNAGTTTKPYTNFFGSYNPVYTNGFIITATTNYSYTTNETITASSTNINSITTNIVSTSYTSNSIVNVINADINGNFSLYGGSFTPVAPAPGYATFTVSGNLTLDNNYGVNNLNFLLNSNTVVGGGSNDLINVTGTLNIGDNVNIVVSPANGSLASGTYTLMESSNLVLSGGDINNSGPANFTVIAQRGISGTITHDSQNVYLQASGTATPGSIVWAATNAANDQWNIHVTPNWKNGGSPDYFFSGDNVAFDDTGFGTISLFGPVTPGSLTFNNNKTNYTFSASTAAFISGNAGLTLNGSASVTLNNPNSFTGNTTINNGTLILGSYGGGGEVLLYNGVTPAQLVFGGPGTFEQNEALPDVLQTTPFSGLTLNSGANATITSNGRGSGDISYISFGGVNRSIGSALYVNYTVRASSTANGVYFTNTPVINGLLGGWAHVGNDWLLPQTNFLGAAPASGVLNYVGYPLPGLTNWVSTNNIALTNVTFAVTGSSNIYSLKLLGPVTVNQTAGTTLTILSGGLLVSSLSAGGNTISGGTLKGAAGGDLIVLQNYTPSPLTIGSIIADNGSPTALTLGGLGGTLILTNNNTYSGVTYINGGTLQVGAGTALGSIATSSSIIDNGALSFNRPDATSVGAISGLGGIIQAGNGTLTLTANNTLSGVIAINAGTVQLGTGGTSGSISNAASVVNSGTLVFNNSGTTSYPKVISGTGNVVQQGTGALVISTNETYTGNTIISNGSVVLTASGSISNTAAIVINAGAVLDASAVPGGLTLRNSAPGEILAGSGKIIGNVTTAPGTTVTPGTNGVLGTLTFMNDLNLNNGNFRFDFVSGTSDKILVGGTLNQNAGLVILNITGTSLANGLYPLIYATNGLGGSYANLVPVGFVQPGQLAVLTNSTPNELDLLVYTGVAPIVTWVGDGSQNLWDTTASSFWKDTNGAPIQYLNGDFVVFDNTGSANPPVNLDASVAPNTITVNSTLNYTFGINGGSGVNKITGGTTLIKNGSGTLTLQTVNDYVGPTTINAGVVQLNGDGGANDDGMIGNANNVTNNGTLIVNNANAETLSGNLNGNGPLIQQGVGPLILAGNNSAYAGPITLSNILQVGNGFTGTLGTGNVTNNGSLNFNISGSLVVTPNISGTGGITNLAGTVNLNGIDTYAGITTIAGGTTRMGSANAIPSTTTVVLNDSASGAGTTGTLDLNGQNLTINALVGNNTGNGLATLAESTILNNGNTTNTLTITGGTTNTFNGQIIDNNNSGNGKVALAVINGSQLTLVTLPTALATSSPLPFPNTFSGGVTISNATLFLGAVVSTTPTAEGTAAIGNLGTQNILMTGTNASFYTADWAGSSGPTIQTTVGTITVPTGTTAFISGAQRGQLLATALTGGGNVIYQPNYVRNRLNFGNASGFTGTLTLSVQQPQSNTGGNLGYDGAAGFPNTLVILGITNLQTVTFAGTIAGNVLPFGSLSGGDNTVQLAGGTNPSGDGTANTIYAIGGLNSNMVVGCQFIDAGCSIRKVGTGTLTLTNAILSYGGQTVVSNGTLAFAPTTTTNALAANYLVGTNFTLVSPGIMDVTAVGGTLYLGHAGAQTLYGNGTLNGSLVVSNSIVAPGRRASLGATNYFSGSLTINNSVTLLGGSTVVLGLNRTNSPANNSITAMSIAYGGSLIVTNYGDTLFPPQTTNTFQLFSGPISGSFTNITLPALTAGEFWITNNLNVNGTISLGNTNSPVNTNAATANFTATVSGGSLLFNWAPDHLGWQLYTNAISLTASSSWFPVPGSAAVTNETIGINPAKTNVFFQLRYP